MRETRPVCFVVIGGEVTSWSGWNDAIDSVYHRRGIDPRKVWLRDTPNGVLVLDGNPQRYPRRIISHIATIYLSEPQYQAAKSRGDIQ